MHECQRIVRTVCWFARTPDPSVEMRLRAVRARLVDHGFQVQTMRICCPRQNPGELTDAYPADDLLLSVGSVTFDTLPRFTTDLYASPRLFLNCDLSEETIGPAHGAALIEMARCNPEATFRFTFTFQNSPSSPYFPSASYLRDGFAVGLQPTNLASSCHTVDEWLERLRAIWHELVNLLSGPDFLGIDSSIAPLFEGPGSLVRLAEALGPGFEQAITTDFFLRITSFLRRENPLPVGLCGLMFPCLEDFALADEYESGRFSVERNLFLSLQSGLGIDTYPFGTDEPPERIAEILRLVQGLAHKHAKPLSVRLVTDGRARIGRRTDFRNPYLRDVTVRPL